LATSTPPQWPPDRRPQRERHSPRRLVRWCGTDAPHYVAQKAAEAQDENAWSFCLTVERAVKELLAEAVPPGTTQP
jgi:hypothetical protein